MKKSAVKYRVGDKVKVRTWEDLKNFYGLYRGYGDTVIPENEYKNVEAFTKGMEKDIKNKFPDRVATILKVYPHYYLIENSQWHFQDYMFEDKDKDKDEEIENNFIYSRFEILDL